MNVIIILIVLLIAIPDGLSSMDEPSGWQNKGDYYQQIMNIGPIRFLKYTQDGKFLFSFGDDNKLRKWDVPTGKLVKETAIGAGEIKKIDISRDGALYAYMYNDLIIRLCRFETNEPLQLGKAKYYEAPCEIYSILLDIDFAFHPAKDIFIIAPLYEFQCPLDLPGVKVYREGCFDLYSSIDGSYISSILSGAAKLYLNFSANGKYITYRDYSEYVYSDPQKQESWSNSPRMIANSDLLPLCGPVPTESMMVNGDYPDEYYPAFSPDSKLLATFDHWSNYFTIESVPYFNLIGGGKIDEFKRLFHLTFTPDSKNLVVGEKNINFINSENGEIYYSVFFGHSNQQWIFSYFPDNPKLTSGSSDGYIRIFNDGISIPLKVAFSPSKYIVNINDTVQFVDYSEGPVNERFWDFGDGTISTAQNPEHIYLDAGKYTVSLILKNNFLSDTLIQKNLITVKNTTDIVTENNFENQISVSPNPADDFIDISCPEAGLQIENDGIQIFNLLGQCVQLSRISAGITHRVNISQLLPGLYILKAKNYYSMFQKN